MKKTFSARRIPRKIEQDDDTPTTTGTAATDTPESAIRRPTVKPRKSTNLRASFGPSASASDDEDAGSGVLTPKKNNLSRVAIQRNRSKRSSLLASTLPTSGPDDDEDRPSYSAASLQELKDSTPTTPRDLATPDLDNESGMRDVSRGTQALDLSSKFGTSLARYEQPSAIPSSAEIAEKKSRRARLAKEQAAEEYISLDPEAASLDDDDDDDPNVTRDENGTLILKPKDKYNMAERRLVHEDEDIMEDFDDFTEDGKMHLGRHAEAEAMRRRRQDMAAQIADAEGSSEDTDDSNTSEKERNAAFEAAQTHHGTYAANTTSTDPYEHLRPRTPPKISPLPTLDNVLERLRREVSEMQAARTQKLKEMEALQREKIHLGEEEVRIQKALKETAEKFQQLRAEKGIPSQTAPAVEAPSGLQLPEPSPAAEERGNGAKDNKQTEAEEDDEQTDDVGHAGLGFSRMSGPGSEWLGAASAQGMSMRPSSEADSD